MPVPSVFKSAPFLYGTTGTVGAAGVVATGWQFLGSGGSEYTTENTPFVGNFKGKPDADLGLDSTSTKAQIDSSYGCFSSFFEGATFPSSSSSDALSSIDSFTNVQPTTITDENKENPVGCMVMQLSYDLKDTKSPKWVFKGEVTIKRGNVGWALWLSGYGGKHEQISEHYQQYGQHMDYKLVFLEKENTGSWKIKTGLGWRDWITSSDFSVRIADPNGKVWIDENARKDHEDAFTGFKTEPKSQVLSYSGVWAKTEGEGKEVFGNVDVVEQDSYEKILLKREGGFAKDISVSHIYDGGSWKPLASSANPSKVKKEDLNKWYKPFKDKKGKWVDIDNYCNVHKDACKIQ